MLVGQTIVHGRHAGRVLIAQVGDLDRGRLAGEDQQPVAADVSGQVDQDVDLVLPHQLGNLPRPATR